MPYGQAPGILYTYLQRKRLQQMSLSKCVIHIWQKSLPVFKMLGRTDYMGVLHGVYADWAFTHVDSSVLCFSIIEHWCENDAMKNG